MCVADARTHVFNAFVSSAKVFILISNMSVSSAESVHPKHKACSLLAEHVCLQCDSYLEVSRKDYDPVASNEHASLQCEIIFGGE